MDKKNKFLLMGLLCLVTLLPSVLAATFDLPSTIEFNEDSSKVIDLNLTLGTGETFVNFTVTDKPENILVAISGYKATFSAKPNWNGEGTVEIKAYYKDATGNIKEVADKTLVKVIPVNDAPVLNLPTSLKFKVGELINYQINATDVDGDSLTFSADAGGWTSFYLDPSGIISFTPTEEDIGLHEVKIIVSDGNATVSKKTDILITFEDDNSYLKISNVEITDETEDESVLAPGDKLAISFDVENRLSETIKKIKLTAWLESETGKRLTDKYEFETFSLEEKSSESFDLNLQIPFDVKDGTYVYVKIVATGSWESDGSKTSALFIAREKVERDTHDIAFESVTLTPSTVDCGSNVDVLLSVWNIGTEEENVTLGIENSALKISEKIDNIKMKASGSSANAIKSLSFIVPTKIKAGNYSLTVYAKYNNGKTTKTINAPIQILCSVPVEQGIANVKFAQTKFDVKQGDDLKIVFEIENIGDEEATFTFDLPNLNWADYNINPTSIKLKAGESTQVTLTISPKEGISGEKSFVLNVLSNNVVTASKQINVTVKTQIIPSINLDKSTALPLIALIIGLIFALGIILRSRNNRHPRVEVYSIKKSKPSKKEDLENY
ncbi:MAG: putative S-layer protein [Candidatus Nanoarchaeia archaeon]